ncbi:MAG: stage II sporulation protein M [Candidatus Pacebacteria bacterium]|nr:stage II sporulation protein M [Candidatus Paceibacterota bacterium]
MNILERARNYYGNELKYFSKDLLKYFYISIAVFLFGIVVSLVVFHNNSDLAIDIFKQIAQSLKEKGLDDLNAGSLSLKIFMNNVEVAIMILFLSLIPLIPFGILICFLNGLIVGLIAFVFYLKISNLYLLIISILPHGIIELPVIFYTTAMSLLIWKKVNLSIMNKKSSPEINLLKIVKSLLFIIIPFLIIASLIESFITPIFLPK